MQITSKEGKLFNIFELFLNVFPIPANLSHFFKNFIEYGSPVFPWVAAI